MLLALSRRIDGLTRRIGQGFAWMIVAAILVSAVNALVRKLIGTSSNAWLELQWLLFGAVVLFCAPWTLAQGEHIRIDILSGRLAKRTRDWIDLIGHAFFLLPIAGVMVWLSWPYFLASAPTWASVQAALGNVVTMPPWRALGSLLALGEQSQNAGGLPVWPAKLLIPLGFALLFLQGVSELIKRIAIMSGQMAEPAARRGHHASAEAEVESVKAAIVVQAPPGAGSARQPPVRSDRTNR